MAHSSANIWIDASGKTRLTIISTATGAAPILAELEAFTNAGLVEWWEGVPTVPGQAGLNNTYPSVRDYVRLQFTTASEEIATLTLVAPVDSIFLPDHYTVDSSAIGSLITACIGNLQAASGEVVTAFLGGERLNGTTSEYVVGGGNVGTVTSVGLSMPSPFTVSDSPVTSTGTISVDYSPTVDDGTLIIGRGSDHTMGLGLITAGSGVTVTNSAYGIEIAATGGGGLSTELDWRPTNLSIDVANTWFDVTVVSLTAGTWLLLAMASMVDNGVGSYQTLRLFDGTSVISQLETQIYTVNVRQSATIIGLYVATGAVDVGLQCASPQTSGELLFTPLDNSTFGAEHTTELIALKIA